MHRSDHLAMVHLPPGAGLLNAYANNGLAWWKALAEFVDNSIDAGASKIVIDVSGKTLTVSDDGDGVEDILAMFKLGEHKKSRKCKLGRYGIGAKDAWLSCSDEMAVDTVRNGMRSQMLVNYIDWMQNDWTCDDPICEASEKPSGTKIKLYVRKEKNRPDANAFRTLAFVFTPAIHSGIQIVEARNGKQSRLVPFAMPSREDIVVSEFEIEGKKVKIDIGVLPDGVKVERGPFWLIHEHRIIESTSIGAGQYSVQRIAGTIEIGREWKLSKNKDDLTDNQERLADAIFVRIEHILKKADALAETVESSALKAELQDMLNGSIDGAKKVREKRKPGDSTGSAAPANSGRKRTKASETQDVIGSVDGTNKSGRRGGFILDWCELDESMIGSFDRSGCRVKLNTCNAFVARMKEENNKPALYACCASLIADFACRHDDKGRSLFKFSFGDFSEAFGSIAKGVATTEVKHAKAEA
jgi:hypothetical protein